MPLELSHDTIGRVFDISKQVFKSGMQRDTDEGKVRWDLLYDGPMLKRWAEHLTRGGKHYGDRNWMKANGQEELDRFRQSAARHFAQWMQGDASEDHAAATMFNLNGAEYVKATMEELGEQSRTCG